MTRFITTLLALVLLTGASYGQRCEINRVPKRKLVKENAALKYQVQQLLAKLAAEKRARQQVVREKKILQKQVVHFKKAYQQACVERQQYKKQVVHFKKAYQQACAKRQQYKKQAAHLQKSNNKLQVEKQILKKKIHALQIQCRVASVQKSYTLKFTGFSNTVQQSKIHQLLYQSSTSQHALLKVIGSQVDYANSDFKVEIKWLGRNLPPQKVFRKVQKTLKRGGISTQLIAATDNTLIIVPEVSHWQFSRS